MADDFNAMKEKIIEERKEKEMKKNVISNAPFVSGSTINKGKNEAAFADEIASFLAIDE